MLGIKLKYECPACGNIITVSAPFWTEDYRKKFKDPATRCSCGRRGGFTLLTFEPCQFEVVKEKKEPEPATEASGEVFD